MPSKKGPELVRGHRQISSPMAHFTDTAAGRGASVLKTGWFLSSPTAP